MGYLGRAILWPCAGPERSCRGQLGSLRRRRQAERQWESGRLGLSSGTRRQTAGSQLSWPVALSLLCPRRSPGTMSSNRLLPHESVVVCPHTVRPSIRLSTHRPLICPPICCFLQTHCVLASVHHSPVLTLGQMPAQALPFSPGGFAPTPVYLVSPF